MIAAGEHWPGQDVLRPALEDLLGAAAVISALAENGIDRLAPEAIAAEACYAGIADIASVVANCASGRELADMGFGADVSVATEIDASDVVPVLVEGAFVDACSHRIVG